MKAAGRLSTADGWENGDFLIFFNHLSGLGNFSVNGHEAGIERLGHRRMPVGEMDFQVPDSGPSRQLNPLLLHPGEIAQGRKVEQVDLHRQNDPACQTQIRSRHYTENLILDLTNHSTGGTALQGCERMRRMKNDEPLASTAGS